MPVQRTCPHCQSRLAIPTKFVGRVVDCPRCSRPFTIAADDDPEGAVTTSDASKIVAAATTGKTARLITAKPVSADAVVLAGQLPELNLAAEASTKEEKANDEQPAGSVLPYIAICGSMLLSLLMLLMDFDGASGVTQINKERLRQRLKDFYAGDDLRPFQIHLREAHMASSRGDRRAAEQHYRKVLEMIRAEDVHPFKGITGVSKSKDEELEQIITRLLRK